MTNYLKYHKQLTADQLKNLMSCQDVADCKQIHVSQIRRMAAGGKVPGKVIVMKKIGFIKAEITNWIPIPARRKKAARSDNRTKWHIWLTTEEAEGLNVQEYELYDPRAASKAKRLARTKNQIEALDRSPFKVFEKEN